ncbi:hypothetical protein P8C59_007820 [Phyllachora maydis]|uniref:Uncharacterized protein n=1 Tax=Phyllachora maydis TaxID=1825666 RepID=A0AAD9I9H2_9PEZI|nr:hypothetical protein P8C59_007820 [Phyllachora maydis]
MGNIISTGKAFTATTVGGWAVVGAFAAYYFYNSSRDRRRRDVIRNVTTRQRLEDRQSVQSRKESKDKTKRQRGESNSQDVEDTEKSSKTKARAAPEPVQAPPTQNHGHSSDEGVDNKEFARQFANVQAGTTLNGSKKKDDKKQKSVKQSRAREIEKQVTSKPAPAPVAPSAPSSTGGADADDDESDTPVAETAKFGDVSDMLEPKATGPSMLRITGMDTVKQKPKPKKTPKAPEDVETKKQRQNRRKVEELKAAREEAEKQRKKAMEAQRRLARISEGRPAKDGSAFTAQQNKPSVWTGNGVNGVKENSKPGNFLNYEYLPVQPLDTGDASIQTDASASSPPSVNKAGSWMSDLPSEEEQMEMLRHEEQWNTVTSKKSTRKNQKTLAEEPIETAVFAPQSVVSVKSDAAVTKAQKAPTNGKPAQPAFSHQSSFAALSTNEDAEEVEEEWDV